MALRGPEKRILKIQGREQGGLWRETKSEREMEAKAKFRSRSEHSVKISF